MTQLDRLKVFLESLPTPELQRCIVAGEQRVDDYAAEIDEIQRRMALEREALLIVEDIVKERYSADNHLPKHP